jgi:hypothetical protein
MSEPIAVEAWFDVDGNLKPMAFEWNEQHFIIDSHGRHWKEDGNQHFLVMVAGDQVFELAYLRSKNQWQLIRTPQDFNRPQIV